MKNLKAKALAAAMLFMGAVGSAQAQSDYAAGFRLAGDNLSAFDSGAASRWLGGGEGSVGGSIYTYEQDGGTFDPVTGIFAPTWKVAGAKSGSEPAFSGLDIQARQHIAGEDYTIFGEVTARTATLQTALHLTGDTGAGTAHGRWMRDFVLASGESATLSGIAVLSVQGTGIDPLGPLVASHGSEASAEFFGRVALNPGEGFSSVGLADAAGRVASRIGVAFSGDLLGNPEAIHYATDAGTGLMSLTVTNATARSFTGTFLVDSFSHVVLASPVPEPETYASLLVGLGVVGGMSRRKKRGAGPDVAMG